MKEGPEVKELTLRGQEMEEELKLIEEEMEWSDDEEYEIESEIVAPGFISILIIIMAELPI